MGRYNDQIDELIAHRREGDPNEKQWARNLFNEIRTDLLRYNNQQGVIVDVRQDKEIHVAKQGGFRLSVKIDRLGLHVKNNVTMNTISQPQFTFVLDQIIVQTIAEMLTEDDQNSTAASSERVS